MKRYLNRIFSVMLGAAVLTASVPAAVPFTAFAATEESSGITLNPIVIGYEVLNSNGKAMGSVTPSTTFRLKISIKDIKVKTSQVGASSNIDFIKSMDDFKGTVESLTITSSGDELLKYDVVLSGCKWTGGDKAFGFMVGYAGGNDYATGSVTITECNIPDKTETPDINVAEPIIKISAVEPDAPIKAGETGEFKIRLKNLGSTAAYNILAEVSPSDDILIIEGTGTQDIESIDFKGEKVLTIKYKALEKINAEKQNFGVSLRYYYDNGTSEATGSASAQVAVAAEVSTVEKVYPVVLTDFSLAETTLEAGKDYTGVLTVRNIGSADMNGVFVNIASSDGIFITGGTGNKYFDSIPVNTEKKINISFRTMEEFTALRQSLTASLKYTYKYGSEEPDGSYEQTFIMLGKAVEETTPLPVITYEPFVNPLVAGGQYRKAFTITNKGTGDMNNITIKVKGSDCLNLVKGSDQFFVDSIKAGKSKRILVNFNTLADITSATQSLDIDIEYYYDKAGVNTADTKTGSIYLSSEVSTVPVLRISGSGMTEALTADQEYSYTILVKNYGDITVRDVFADLTASDDMYFLDGTESGFISIIRPGDTAKLKVKFRTNQDITAARQSITAAFKYSYGRDTSIKQAEGTSSLSLLSKVTDGRSAPVLRVSGARLPQALVSDTEYSYTLYVKNYGDTSVSNVMADLTATDDMYFLDGTDSGFISEIKPGETAELNVKFHTSEKITAIKQVITAGLKYSYGSSKQAESTSTVSLLAAVADANAPMVRISGEKLGKALVADTEYDYVITFKNFGDTAVKDVFIDLTSTDDMYFLDGTEAGFISEIAPGGTADLSVRFRTLKKINSVKQGITAAMKYTYGEQEEKQAEATSSVTLIAAAEGVAGDSAAAPNIIIGKYDIGADQIAAGDVFTLDLDFYNTSASTSIENVVMTIGASGDLSIYGGSSSFFYQSLAAAAASSESIQLRALPTAATGTSSVTVSFKYDYVVNDTRTTLTSDQTIYIPLYQPDKLTLSVSTPTYDVYVGNEVYITLSYMNKGRADASNVKAEIVASSTPADNGAGSDIGADDGMSGVYGTAEGMINSGADDGITPLTAIDSDSAAAGETGIAVDGMDYADGGAMGSAGYIDGDYSDGGYSDPGYTALSTEKVIGNIQAGGNGTVDFVVTPTMGGTVSFVIKVTYEDSNMNEIVKELPVSFTAIEQQWDFPDYPMTVETTESGEGGFPWIAVIIGGSVLVVAAVVVIIVVVHKKRKNGKKLTADDIDWEDELDDDKSDSNDTTKV